VIERLMERHNYLNKDYDFLKNIPIKEYDDVFYIVSTLCLAYGQSAFYHGLRLGFAFAQELAKE